MGYVWQDSEKCFVVMMLIGPFVFVLVVAQLAQTYDLPACSDSLHICGLRKLGQKRETWHRDSLSALR